jgi:CRISPR-associated endonuclease/helicase Cas3
MAPTLSSSENGLFALISHPHQTLDEHLGSCNEISQIQLGMKYINEAQFFPKTLLETMRHLLVYFHDFGKGTDYFQLKIIEAIEDILKDEDIPPEKKEAVLKFAETMKPYFDAFDKGKRKAASVDMRKDYRLGNHALLGAYLVLYQLSHDDDILRFILLKAIRRHHGDLTNFWVAANGRKQIQLEEEDIAYLEKQLSKLDSELYQNILESQGLKTGIENWLAVKAQMSDNDEIDCMMLDFKKNKDTRYFFLQHFLFSLLLSSDKGDMMLEKGKDKKIFLKENRILPPDIIDLFKQRTLKPDSAGINIHREQAYRLIADNALQHSSANFFSITLPTGLGKTFAAYNAAVILQNEFYKQTEGCKPRIVYCLPFTSIIDQNAEILRGILHGDERTDETWLSKNHYLSTHNEKYDELQLQNDESEYLADGWEHEVIVTTFVQFLESIFTNRNRSLRKFHNMTNAIFVLDEIQNVPPDYYEVIELVFKEMARYFNAKFVFVTATQPFLFKNPADVRELTHGHTEAYFRNLDRIVLDQRLIQENNYLPMEEQEFEILLIRDIEENPDKSFLIIFNTIAQSLHFFETLENAFPDDLHIYLSSSILPIVRSWNIRKIKKDKRRKIVVSTQVVEAGVDIDLDIVYRDFAPVDSINQSAGRCNRNGLKGKGRVKLFNLGKHRRIYSHILMSITEEVLKPFKNEILESQLYDLNIAYAAAVRRRITDDNDKSLKLIKAIQQLQLEDIEKDFNLIEEDARNYNVFLPCSKGARYVWSRYVEMTTIKDPFERKREIKKWKPRLLKYVTRFPKNSKYIPDNKDEFMIYEPDWQKWYDLDRGFKLEAKADISIIV